MFERAAKKKYRYQTPRGFVTTEDLWDLPLDGNEGHSLNGVAIGLYKQIEEKKETNFVETFVARKTKEGKELNYRLELVKRVIEVRLEDLDRKEKRKSNSERKAKILDALAEKEEASLKNKSAKALREELASFDDDDED